MGKWTKIVLGSLLLVILILLAIIIFRQPETIVVPDEAENKRLLKENQEMKQRFDSLQLINDSIIQVNNELNQLERTIKIIYRDKYKFIKGATTDELDSIIRAHTGLPPKP